MILYLWFLGSQGIAPTLLVRGPGVVVPGILFR